MSDRTPDQRSRKLMCGSRFEGYLCQRQWHRTGKHRHKNITELKGKGERYELTWWGDRYFPRYGRLS
jgi:hypothetical protein